MGFGDGNGGYNPSRTDVDASTKTGGSLDQTHQFTGSVDITGSLIVNGVAISSSGGGGGSGDITGVTAGTGISGGGSSGDVTVTLDLAAVIASDGANRMLTSDNDGTLTAEANVTYDGTTFTAGDNVTLGAAVTDVTTVTGQLTASADSYFSGNVGIGITSPVEILHVGSDEQVTNIDASQKIRISQLANVVSARVNLVAGVIGGDDPYFAIETRDGADPWLITEKFRIDHTGNVGIGTTTPDKTLAVDGTFGCTGSATFKSNVTLGDAATDVTTVTGQLTASVGMFVPDGEGISIRGHRPAPNVMLHAEATTNGAGVRIDSDATSKFGCLVFANNGDTSDYGLIALAGSSGAALPIVGVAHESLCLRTQGNDQQIAFSTDGGSSTVLVIDGTNVGIGPDVLSPGSTLTVDGTANFTGNVTFDANVTLGDAVTDVTTVTGQLTASHGAYFADRVGIGTSTPGTILEIGDGTAVDTITINSLQGSNDTLMSTILFENNTDSVAMINAFRGSSATAGELRFGTQKTAGVSYQMTIDEDGNVGIGTTTPDKVLAVDGTFGCTGSATFKSNVTLGDAATDVTTVTGRLTASVGAQFTGSPIGIGLAATNNAGGRGPANPQNLVTIYGSNTVTGGGGLTIDSTGSQIGVAGQTNAGMLNFANEGTGYFIMGAGGGTDNIWSDLARGDMFYRQTADKRQMWGNRDDAGWDMVLSGSRLGIGPSMGTLTHTLQVVGTISGSSTLDIAGATALNGNVTLGDAITNITTVTSQLTASVGALISGSVGENVIIVANQGSSGAGGNTGPRGFALGVQNVQDYGSIRLEQHSTDEVAQRTAIFTKHYTNAKEDHLLIGSYTDADETIVAIGGGLGPTGDFNSCTTLRFHAAADTTTTNTSPIITITSAGQYTIGAISGSSTLDIAGASTFGASVSPSSDNQYDLGSSSKRWANVYTGDLHLKNERGNWTILEEEDYLCVINNKTGKKFKMMLQEIED